MSFFSLVVQLESVFCVRFSGRDDVVELTCSFFAEPFSAASYENMKPKEKLFLMSLLPSGDFKVVCLRVKPAFLMWRGIRNVLQVPGERQVCCRGVGLRRLACCCTAKNSNHPSALRRRLPSGHADAPWTKPPLKRCLEEFNLNRKAFSWSFTACCDGASTWAGVTSPYQPAAAPFHSWLKTGWVGHQALSL